MVLASLSWLLIAGGVPSGLMVEEQVHEATYLAVTHALVQRHGRIKSNQTVRPRWRHAIPASQSQPGLDARCQRTRIRSLPIDRRGPPVL